LILSGELDFVLPSLLKPYPGSPISKNPKSFEINLINSWDSWLGNYYLPMWNSKRFKQKDLMNLNLKYLQTIINAYEKRNPLRIKKKRHFMKKFSI
ncbi:MAG TPA: hypothetical protein HA227_01315, partial [Candidatus Diapherotrites archaeon]|nr:hypothetical protein [Candidatus Diapherotrites archaeon]